MLTWHYVDRATYDAASAADKTSDKLFFLSDTHEIYKGTENYTENVIIYETEPTVIATGKLYINSTTLEGKMYDGTAWHTVIKPVSDTVVEDDGNPVSGKAVADYIKEQISEAFGFDVSEETLILSPNIADIEGNTLLLY